MASTGRESEDNEDGFTIGGVKVDINPITEGKTGTLGEYHEGIADAPEAIAIFNQIPPERMNGIPSIGINIHTAGTKSYEDTQMDIVSGRVADLEILNYVPEITDNPKAVEVIAELMDKLPDIEVRGSLEKWQANKPEKEIKKQPGRISIKEKLSEKKAAIEQRDKADKEVREKVTDKKSEREV